jgi:hypothetical protein
VTWRGVGSGMICTEDADGVFVCENGGNDKMVFYRGQPFTFVGSFLKYYVNIRVLVC